jgi:methyl-accepting chemotaxis protein
MRAAAVLGLSYLILCGFAGTGIVTGTMLYIYLGVLALVIGTVIAFAIYLGDNAPQPVLHLEPVINVPQVTTAASEALIKEYNGNRNTTMLADALSTEVGFQVAATITEMSTANEGAGQVISHVSAMADVAKNVANHAGMIAQQMDAVAAVTEELDASSNEIAFQMKDALSKVHVAADQAREIAGIMGQMETAMNEIRSVTALIENVASQTNLLALNATIEAARAGEAGKGFAVVANEVKQLANQTAKATDDISSKINSMLTVGATASKAMVSISNTISSLTETASSVSAAVDQQRAATQEITRSVHNVSMGARETSTSIGAISEESQRIDDLSVAAAQRLGVASDTLDKLNTLIREVLNQSVANLPKRSGPLPIDLPCQMLAPVNRQVIVSHVEPGSFVIKDADLADGTPVEVILPTVGTVRGTARQQNGVIGVEFPMTDSLEGPLSALLTGYKGVDAPYLALTMDTAKQVSDTLAEAVRRGEVKLEDLFDHDYQPINGTDPQQYTTRSLSFMERVLPTIQEPTLTKLPHLLYCACIDINGFLPMHNKQFSQPQRSGDPVWNSANSRNRRIYTDRAAVAASTNTKPVLHQSYLRDMGGGNYVLMQDISAPVVINGKHWGCVRIGYRL